MSEHPAPPAPDPAPHDPVPAALTRRPPGPRRRKVRLGGWSATWRRGSPVISMRHGGRWKRGPRRCVPVDPAASFSDEYLRTLVERITQDPLPGEDSATWRARAHLINQHARLHQAQPDLEDPTAQWHPAIEVGGLFVNVYVDEEGDGYVIAVDFDGVPDWLAHPDSSTRLSLTYNGEPQRTYDRSSGIETT